MGTRISQFTPLTTVASADYFPLVQASDTTNKRVSLASLLASVPLGSAATPSIAFTGDLNTGIFSPGADQVAVATNGTGRFKINASGYLIAGANITAYVGGSILYPTSNGVIDLNSNVADVPAVLKLGSTGFSNTVPYSTGAIEFRGFDSVGNTIGYASIEGLISESTAATRKGTIVFKTINASTVSEKMRLTAEGSLGIGTTSPAEALTVVGNINLGVLNTSTARTISTPNCDTTASAALTIQAGQAESNAALNASGGAITLAAGNVNKTSTANGVGGSATVRAGDVVNGGITSSDGSGGAGDLTLRAGNNPCSGSSSSRAGDVFINGGNLALTGGSNGNSGSITLAAGTVTTNSHSWGGSYGIIKFNVANSERARIDSSGRLLVGTSNSGTSSATGQLRLGGTGAHSGSVLLSNASQSVANSGTVDITVGTSAVIIYVGFLIVNSMDSVSNASRTQTTFSIFASPQNSSFTATAIATATGAGSRTFTVTSPSAGVIRVTNTSGGNSDIAMCFMGTGGFMS